MAAPAAIPNGQRLGGDEAFTNRQSRWQTILAALTDHLSHLAGPGFDVEDPEVPRNNVLVFHGVGGIGKTTLSRKLEAALIGADQRPAQWSPPAWPEGPSILPVRIALARSADTDFERVIPTIRLALTGLGRRPAGSARPMGQVPGWFPGGDAAGHLLALDAPQPGPGPAGRTARGDRSAPSSHCRDKPSQPPSRPRTTVIGTRS
ncbi:hypothetical protein ABTZ59_36925 [Streptomyces sp. NPDC094034]|uniref:hypothetical protein n=1 Tax=Streptomyces sp. NPDC094034 TaxID=3155309 RepID=UPI00332F77A4